MSDTCQIPHEYRITSSNASAMARKSWDARRAKLAQTERKLELAELSTPQSERIAKQLRSIERMMNQTKDADTLQKLSAAHARLFNAWQVLTGTPNPGSRRSKGRDKPEAPIA